MSKLKKFFSSFTLWVFVGFFVCMLPSAIYEPSEFDKKGVVSSVGLDKNDNGEIEASVLIVVPQTGSSQSQTLKLFSASGDTLSQAMLRISLNIGKNLGYAHCEAVVINVALLEENVTEYLDYFIRSNNVTSNLAIVASKDKAKDVLNALSSSENSYASSIRDLISFNNEYLFTTDMTLETYYMYMLGGNQSCFFPLIEVGEGQSSGSSAGGESSASGASESQGSSGGSGGGSSSSGASENAKSVSSNGSALVIKNGKMIRELSEDEKYGYNLLSKITTKGIITIDNVTDEVLNNATLIYEIKSKYVFYNVKFMGGKPVFNITMLFIITLDEMLMKDYGVIDLEDIKSYTSPVVEKALNDKVNELYLAVVNGMKESNVDTLKIADRFDAYCHSDWQNYLNGLENKDDYLSGIIFTSDLSLKSKL